MFESGIYHYYADPPQKLSIELYFDRDMSWAGYPDPTSWSVVTNLGPVTVNWQGWHGLRQLGLETTDPGGIPTWVTVEFLHRDPGLRSEEMLLCCPFGPADLVLD